MDEENSSSDGSLVVNPIASFSPGIGAKLMLAMGYVEGQGLGSHNQGRLDPIIHAVRPERAGLGYPLTGPTVTVGEPEPLVEARTKLQQVKKQIQDVTQILEHISLRTDLHVLYDLYREQWSQLLLDKLSLGTLSEIVRELDFDDGRLVDLVEKWEPMLPARGHTQLLHSSWLPKLKQKLSEWPNSEIDILIAVTKLGAFLDPIKDELCELIFSRLTESSPHILDWVAALDVPNKKLENHVNQIILRSAPRIPAQLFASNLVFLFNTVVKALAQWLLDAPPAQVASIDLENWRDFGISEDNLEQIILNSLASISNIEDLVQKYEYIAPQLNGAQVKLDLLNRINSLLDRSSEVTYQVAPATLEEILEDHCLARDIVLSVDAKGVYTLKGSKTLHVEIRDNVFWMSGLPIDLFAMEIN